MIREMEKQTGSSRPVSYEVLKKKRSAVLHQMQLMGIDTANWAAVDNFCFGRSYRRKEIQGVVR